MCSTRSAFSMAARRSAIRIAGDGRHPIPIQVERKQGRPGVRRALPVDARSRPTCLPGGARCGRTRRRHRCKGRAIPPSRSSATTDATRRWSRPNSRGDYEAPLYGMLAVADPDRGHGLAGRHQADHQAERPARGRELRPTLLWDGEWEVDLGSRSATWARPSWSPCSASTSSSWRSSARSKLPLVILTPDPADLSSASWAATGCGGAPFSATLDDRLHRA